MKLVQIFQKIQKVRQIHVARTIRLLFGMSFCGACIEYQMIAMTTKEGLLKCALSLNHLNQADVKDSKC